MIYRLEVDHLKIILNLRLREAKLLVEMRYELDSKFEFARTALREDFFLLCCQVWAKEVTMFLLTT